MVKEKYCLPLLSKNLKKGENWGGGGHVLGTLGVGADPPLNIPPPTWKQLGNETCKKMRNMLKGGRKKHFFCISQRAALEEKIRFLEHLGGIRT